MIFDQWLTKNWLLDFLKDLRYSYSKKTLATLYIKEISFAQTKHFAVTRIRHKRLLKHGFMMITYLNMLTPKTRTIKMEKYEIHVINPFIFGLNTTPSMYFELFGIVQGLRLCFFF